MNDCKRALMLVSVLLLVAVPMSMVHAGTHFSSTHRSDYFRIDSTDTSTLHLLEHDFMVIPKNIEKNIIIDVLPNNYVQAEKIAPSRFFIDALDVSFDVPEEKQLVNPLIKLDGDGYMELKPGIKREKLVEEYDPKNPKFPKVRVIELEDDTADSFSIAAPEGLMTRDATTYLTEGERVDISENTNMAGYAFEDEIEDINRPVRKNIDGTVTVVKKMNK